MGTVPTSAPMLQVQQPIMKTQTVPATPMHLMPQVLPPMSVPAYTKPGPYVTKLDTKTENAFQNWVKTNKIPWEDVPTADYDMRGFYKAMIHGDPDAKRSSTNLHFPDTWKTPYDKSFSNESIYATKDAPHWVGNKLVDTSGKVVFDEDKDGPG